MANMPLQPHPSAMVLVLPVISYPSNHMLPRLFAFCWWKFNIPLPCTDPSPTLYHWPVPNHTPLPLTRPQPHPFTTDPHPFTTDLSPTTPFYRWSRFHSAISVGEVNVRLYPNVEQNHVRVQSLSLSRTFFMPRGMYTDYMQTCTHTRKYIDTQMHTCTDMYAH
jgi:hypothetical protein